MFSWQVALDFFILLPSCPCYQPAMNLVIDFVNFGLCYYWNKGQFLQHLSAWESAFGSVLYNSWKAPKLKCKFPSPLVLLSWLKQLDECFLLHGFMSLRKKKKKLKTFLFKTGIWVIMCLTLCWSFLFYCFLFGVGDFVIGALYMNFTYLYFCFYYVQRLQVGFFCNTNLLCFTTSCNWWQKVKIRTV